MLTTNLSACRVTVSAVTVTSLIPRGARGNPEVGIRCGDAYLLFEGPVGDVPQYERVTARIRREHEAPASSVVVPAAWRPSRSRTVVA